MHSFVIRLDSLFTASQCQCQLAFALIICFSQITLNKKRSYTLVKISVNKFIWKQNKRRRDTFDIQNKYDGLLLLCNINLQTGHFQNQSLSLFGCTCSRKIACIFIFVFLVKMWISYVFLKSPAIITHENARHCCMLCLSNSNILFYTLLQSCWYPYQ